jgi:hypothetical protein
VCRTSGAWIFFCCRFPVFTHWANLWRASGAQDRDSENARCAWDACDTSKLSVNSRGRYIRQIQGKMAPVKGRRYERRKAEAYAPGAWAEAPFRRMAFLGVNLHRSLYPTAARAASNSVYGSATKEAQS